jgi:hypothetical protein
MASHKPHDVVQYVVLMPTVLLELACPQGFDAYCTSRILPLHMSIDDATPLSPDHVESE